MDEQALREIVKRIQTLSRRLRYDGPQNDDELHLWVKINLGVDIPRVAVCSDHVAPFTFLADLYFERVNSALGLANRGGSKTFIVAVLHFLNSTYKPGCESLSFGDSEAQGQRCYSHIEDWCYEREKDTGRRTDVVKEFIKDKPLKSHTEWKTGSKVEVVAGSLGAVSGPHPAKAHADEIDMMDEPVWNQSRGMAVSLPAKGPLPKFMDHFHGVIPPQDIATSTRNSTKGRMQELIEEVAQDLRAGDIPTYTIYTWCIWETAAEVPNCRNAPKAEREARCKELGLDPKELCLCNRVPKGYWNADAPSPALVDKRRYLQHACAVYDENGKVVDGKAFRSRGWKPYVDLRTTFKRNTPGTWVLQHECREGKDENIYIENWSLAEYGIKSYEPHPLYGPIYQGVDWGTGHPACVLWFQYLTSEVPAIDFLDQPIWLQPGTYVLFKEIYVSGIDSQTLAGRVVRQEAEYKAQFGPEWKVDARFCDPAGKGDRLIFLNHGMPSGWPIKTRDKTRMIENVQNIVMDDRFAVDVEQAPMFCQEVEGWGKNPKTGKEIDKRNHAMAAWRYGLSNAEVVESHKAKQRGELNTQVATNTARNGTENYRPNHMTVVSGHRHYADEYGETRVVSGAVAMSGETGAPLDPQFSLHH